MNSNLEEGQNFFEEATPVEAQQHNEQFINDELYQNENAKNIKDKIIEVGPANQQEKNSNLTQTLFDDHRLIKLQKFKDKQKIQQQYSSECMIILESMIILRIFFIRMDLINSLNYLKNNDELKDFLHFIYLKQIIKEVNESLKDEDIEKFQELLKQIVEDRNFLKEYNEQSQNIILDAQQQKMVYEEVKVGLNFKKHIRKFINEKQREQQRHAKNQIEIEDLKK